MFLALAATAQAASIEEIQQAIKEKGGQWTADYNEAWYMHELYGWYEPTLQFPALTGREEYFAPDKSALDLPATLDWRDYQGVNFVTTPKNQYSCGSCWAFSTTGPIESHIAIAENWPDPRIDLSEQQMLSCDNSPGNQGCNGGFTTTSFEYAKNTGIFDEQCLPYHASDTWPCDDRCDDWADRLFKIDSWQIVGDWGIFITPEQIMEAMQYGPLGTSLTIYEDFYAYTGGIYDTMISWPLGFHAVTIVGYDANQEYWICKNSWGDNWGESGFFRIKWGAAVIGMFTILPAYTSQGLGPEPDDDDVADDDDDDAVDDDDDDDNDSGSDDDDTGNDFDDDDDDDNDSGGCS